MARRQQRGRLKWHDRREVGGRAACECGWAAAGRDRYTMPMSNRARSAHLIDVRMALEEITTKA